MFYKGGEVIYDQFHPLKFIWFWVSLHRNGKVLGILPLRGGVALFPKVNVKILPFFCENQKCSLWPKMQNKHQIFFVNRMSQKGGVGGGPAIWENSQKMSFFFWTSPLMSIWQSKAMWQCKWLNLVDNFGAHASGATYRPKFKPMQVAQIGEPTVNWWKWHPLVTKFVTDASTAIRWPNL